MELTVDKINEVVRKRVEMPIGDAERERATSTLRSS